MSKIVSPEEAQRIRVLFGDQLGLARGKYIPRRFAEHGEARFCAGAYAVTYAKDLIDAPGAYLLEGLPDIEAQFNIGELRQGWEDNTAIALSNLTFKDAPYELCGRTAMANAISAWNEKGLTPMIGFETEAYIFQRGENGIGYHMIRQVPLFMAQGRLQTLRGSRIKFGRWPRNAISS